MKKVWSILAVFIDVSYRIAGSRNFCETAFGR